MLRLLLLISPLALSFSLAAFHAHGSANLQQSLIGELHSRIFPDQNCVNLVLGNVDEIPLETFQRYVLFLLPTSKVVFSNGAHDSEFGV